MSHIIYPWLKGGNMDDVHDGVHVSHEDMHEPEKYVPFWMPKGDEVGEAV